jgi:hypothetical protein
MSPSEKLRVLVIRDCLSSAALTGYFFLPKDYGIIAILVSVVIMRVAGKKLKGVTTKLQPPQKRIYFAVHIGSVCLDALILLWILLHISPPAIAMGSLGIIVLLAFSLYVYESIYGKIIYGKSATV